MKHILLFLLLPLALFGQTSVVGPVVRYDAATGTVVAPSNFWSANASLYQSEIDFSSLQPLSPILTSLASLTSTTGNMPFFSGTNTWSGTPSTSWGRALLNLNNAAGLRSYAEIVIGTDVLAYNALINSFASLPSDGLIAKTGTNTSAVRTIQGTVGEVVVSNGGGVSGNPTIALDASVTKLGSSISLDNSETTGILPETKGGTGLSALSSLPAALGLTSTAFTSPGEFLSSDSGDYNSVLAPQLADRLLYYAPDYFNSVSITDGSGDGTVFLGGPITPNTVKVFVGSEEFEDDGSGGLVDSLSSVVGSVNYTTGEVSFSSSELSTTFLVSASTTFSSFILSQQQSVLSTNRLLNIGALSTGPIEPIQPVTLYANAKSSVSIGWRPSTLSSSESIGSTDASGRLYSTLTNVPVVPHTVSVVVDSVVFYDNGSGRIFNTDGLEVGSVVYADGTLILTLGDGFATESASASYAHTASSPDDVIVISSAESSVKSEGGDVMVDMRNGNFITPTIELSTHSGGVLDVSGKVGNIVFDTTSTGAFSVTGGSNFIPGQVYTFENEGPDTITFDNSATDVTTRGGSNIVVQAGECATIKAISSSVISVW